MADHRQDRRKREGDPNRPHADSSPEAVGAAPVTFDISSSKPNGRYRENTMTDQSRPAASADSALGFLKNYAWPIISALAVGGFILLPAPRSSVDTLDKKLTDYVAAQDKREDGRAAQARETAAAIRDGFAQFGERFGRVETSITGFQIWQARMETMLLGPTGALQQPVEMAQPQAPYLTAAPSSVPPPSSVRPAPSKKRPAPQASVLDWFRTR